MHTHSRYSAHSNTARERPTRHAGEALLAQTHRSDEDSVRQGAGAGRGNLRIPAENHEKRSNSALTGLGSGLGSGSGQWSVVIGRA